MARLMRVRKRRAPLALGRLDRRHRRGRGRLSAGVAADQAFRKGYAPGDRIICLTSAAPGDRAAAVLRRNPAPTRTTFYGEGDQSMGCDVYANGDEIACKAGGNKVIAAFPDVCLSPPSPPAGPIPVPYPDTSFSKDMQNGSKTVKIKGKEVMLKDQSFYKTSPWATRRRRTAWGRRPHPRHHRQNLFRGLVDGRQVRRPECRPPHGHDNFEPREPHCECLGPQPQPGCDGRGPPGAGHEDVPACCGGSIHSAGTPMTFHDWYGMNDRGSSGQLTKEARGRRKQLEQWRTEKKARGCSCKVFPEAPCNVFRKPVTRAEHNAIVRVQKNNAANYRHNKGFIRCGEDVKVMFPGISQAEEQKITQINHKTPKNAGGCPTGDGDLALHFDLCSECQKMWMENSATGDRKSPPSLDSSYIGAVRCQSHPIRSTLIGSLGLPHPPGAPLLVGGVARDPGGSTRAGHRLRRAPKRPLRVPPGLARHL